MLKLFRATGLILMLFAIISYVVFTYLETVSRYPEFFLIGLIFGIPHLVFLVFGWFDPKVASIMAIVWGGLYFIMFLSEGWAVQMVIILGVYLLGAVILCLGSFLKQKPHKHYAQPV
jgi:hypothetical protein